jgi:hypothetical protein
MTRLDENVMPDLDGVVNILEGHHPVSKLSIRFPRREKMLQYLWFTALVTFK